jgi:glutathione S-transferase
MLCQLIQGITTMKLYDFPLSGHAHRARLFLSLIGADAEIEVVDLGAGAHKEEAYLKMNAFGQVPVLEDDGDFIPDSNAILIYLAKKYGKTEWLPEDAKGAAAVQRWLSVAAGQLASGPAAARMVTLFDAGFDAEKAIKRSHVLLKIIDAELDQRAFIVGDRATIADIALFSYIYAAPEGNVNLSAYKNVQAWLKRIQSLPGFIPLEESSVGLRSAK